MFTRSTKFSPAVVLPPSSVSATARSVAASFFFILAFFTAAFAAASAQTNTVTIFPVADSYVQNGSSVSTNFGTSQSLFVKNIAKSPARNTYIKFDLSSISSPITSATLQLYGGHSVATAGYSGTDSLYAVADTTWTQTGLTWTNAPAIGARLSSATVTPTQQYYSWDMTSYLQTTVSGGATLASVALQMDTPPADSGLDSFNSTQGPLIPRLVLTLAPGAGPASLTATGVNNQVVLTWPASPNATGYTIQRSSAAGGPFTTIGSSSTNTYTDTAVIPGNAYYYTVTAMVNGLVTSPSPVASVTLGTTITLTPVADAYVQNGTAAATNFGAATTLQAENSTSTIIDTYLKFDLTGVTGPIQSASLQLYGGNNSASGYAGTDNLYAVNDLTWTESGVTFNNAPAFGTLLSSAAITSTQQTYLWDATAAAQSAITNGAGGLSLGLSMSAATANGQPDIFNSKEAASNLPHLVISQLPPSAPAKLTATANDGQVYLQWTTSGAGCTYIVSRAAQTGGPYTTLTTTVSNSFTDTTVTDGTTYYYVVQTTDSGGKSAYSNEASAMPVATALISIAFDPTTVTSGQPSTATVTLNEAAPAAGAVITVSPSPAPTGSPASYTYPTTLTIPAGQSQGTFNVGTSSSVTASTVITFTVKYAGVGKNTKLTINPPSATVNVSVNFQPASSAVPSGYVADTGAAFTTSAGSGWIRQDSITGTHVPIDMSLNTRDRMRAGIAPQLNTIIHMQYPAKSKGPADYTPGAWDYVLPNGNYSVTVSVGDESSGQGGYDSQHTINVNGVNFINRFQGTASQEYLQVTQYVQVTNGLLTVDATGGTNTKMDYVMIKSASLTGQPQVSQTTPTNQSSGAFLDTAITANVQYAVPGDQLDPTTLNSATVTLTQTSNGTAIPGDINTTGGYDEIIFQPSAPLLPLTQYTFTVTAGVKDKAGASFVPYTMTFTTGTSVHAVPDPNAKFYRATVFTGAGPTTVRIGPDGMLYTAFITGDITRAPINPDGTLGAIQTFTGFEGRNVIGLAFDPTNSSVLWVVNDDPLYPRPATDFTGHISKVYLNAGTNFTGTIQDYIVGLPRSANDHMTNSLAFGPDGLLYVTQGSDSGTGAPDSAWDYRAEHLLNASVMQIDPTLTTGLPINVQTEDYNGTTGNYNPYAAGAPLKLYGVGLRNPYDLCWHSNGHLYCPTNGGSAGGNTPASPAGVTPVIPALTNVATQSDFLFDVVPGGYYGHPNTPRGQYVLNGGNPTSGVDPAEVVASGPYAGYPVGTQPDPNYKGFAYDFGKDPSVDGCLEYMSPTFNGALQHKLLVVEYSVGKDILSLGFDANGKVVPGSVTQVYGGNNDPLINPLSLAEDRTNGNIYVAELSSATGTGRISVLRPAYPGISASPMSLTFQQVITAGAAATQYVTITNVGHANLVLAAGSIVVAGVNAADFTVTPPALPISLTPGQSTVIGVALNSTVSGVKSALLTIRSNDPNVPIVSIDLSGLTLPSTSSTTEPSLQDVFTALHIPINTGVTDGAAWPTTGLVGDEIPVQRFVKAGSGPVTVQTLAAFCSHDPTTQVSVYFGYYQSGLPATTTEVFDVPYSQFYTIDPTTVGANSFDPGTEQFGIYGDFPRYTRTVYQEDALNNFAGDDSPHHVRIYAYKNAQGVVVPNTYLAAFSEALTDRNWQDLVVVLQNVMPVPGTIGVANLDGLPYPDRFVFNRIGSLQNPPTNSVHNIDTMQISNSGQAALTIQSIAISGPWILPNAPAFPAVIPVGGTLNVPIQFVATSGRVTNGTLTINSNDPVTPIKTVTLEGYWQTQSEFGQEPTPLEVINTMFGYDTVIQYPGQSFNIMGKPIATGEEVLSGYWTQANAAQPVTVRQLSADHTYPNAETLYWYARQGNTKPTAKLPTVFAVTGAYAQSLLPVSTPALGSFSPNTPFGLRVDSSEYSDDSFNRADAGHHLRFFPLRDRTGAIVPNSYVMFMDYAVSGTTPGNYDYNDNIYLFTNMQPVSVNDAQYVNPLIGTDNPATVNGVGNAGGVFPGADVPFGMVQLSPDTPTGYGGGYNYQDTSIKGFAHTHLSGTGTPLAGDVTLMPTTGAVQTQATQYASTFSHAGEIAQAGYYNVNLSTYGIQAELTATTHVGLHRYTFPATTQANVLVDLSSSFRGATNGSVTIVDNQTIQGSVTSVSYEGTSQTNGTLPYTVYYYIKFDHPFTGFGTWTGTTTTAGSTSATGGNAGAYATFDATANPVVIAKVGLSYVSITGAENNLNEETNDLPVTPNFTDNSDFDFDLIRQNASNAWKSLLARVQVTGGTTAQQTAFYTALYHSLLHPNVFSDDDGSFIGFDNQTHTQTSYTTYTNFSMWDTYRTQSELLDLIAPERAHDQMASLMEIYNETGWLPRWVQNNLETNGLSGDPVDPILVDAYLKGIIPDLNATTVYTALVHNANTLPPAGSEFEGRLGLSSYLANGYVPYVYNAGGTQYKLKFGASTTQEYSLDDGAIALMAQAMGDTSDYNSYIHRAQSYTSIYDANYSSIHARISDGTFSTPFDPTMTGQGFKEGTPDQYTWMEPQDIFGLTDLQGGTTAAASKLDTFFDLTQLQTNPANTVSTIWGLGGNYTPYNELDIQAPYLYPYYGQAYKTQQVVNAAETLYTNSPGGIPGNDDLGTMSAWYVLSALGLYPVSPGSSFYILTTPLFPMAQVALQSPYYSGTSLTISAPGVSATNGYIQSLTLNGSAYGKAWVTHSQLQSGPVLAYTVGATANTAFAAGTANNPPSVVPAH